MSTRRRRSSARPRRQAQSWHQSPWQSVINPYPPLAILDEAGVEAIHDTSLAILEEIGMDFLHSEALDILRAGGADIEAGSQRVRFDRSLVAEAVARAPSSFTLHARNPDHDIEIGGRSVVFGSVSGPPNVTDLDRGRRPGSYEDFCNLVRLCQTLNIVHTMSGYPVEPLDRAPETRHLDCLAGFVSLTDKVPSAYSLGRTRIRDALEIVRIARRTDRAGLARKPGLLSVVNTSSPLRYDAPMIEGSLEMARWGQPVGVTPFTLSGAMAPATLAGALAQQNAEALAVITLLQLARPGLPVIYGGFTTNVDMKSGAPAFGTPEFLKATVIGGQMARRYGLPYRASNVNASNTVDAQATWESVWSLTAAMLGGVNLVMHGVGWLEGGLSASYEKLVLDAELLQQLAEIMSGVDVSEPALGLDAVRDVGPGGHFFGTRHTLERYETAFYAPFLADWRNFESWQEAGSIDATRRAHGLVSEILAAYEEPRLAEDTKEELDDFVARRKREGGAGPL